MLVSCSTVCISVGMTCIMLASCSTCIMLVVTMFDHLHHCWHHIRLFSSLLASLASCSITGIIVGTDATKHVIGHTMISLVVSFEACGLTWSREGIRDQKAGSKIKILTSNLWRPSVQTGAR